MVVLMDRSILNEAQSCHFSYDYLLDVLENIFDILDNLKKTHNKIRKEFTILEKSSKDTLFELSCIMENYEKLEAKKLEIKDKLSKEVKTITMNKKIL